MSYDLGGNSNDLGWPHVCKQAPRGTMVTLRKAQAGFTITELMVVVVIISLLAALSTPLFTRDNTARKGRGWSQSVAQLLQKARFQAMGDHANMHVMLYKERVEVYREEAPIPPSTTTTFTLLATTPGPVASSAGHPTVAIWDARTDTTPPTAQNSNLVAASSAPTLGAPKANEIIFTSMGGTSTSSNWRVYIRNELLPSAHPDASFVINVGGLTGFVSANDKVTLP
jgi:prepilin-type N-terminal cleavage/methylation domain-containing protein